MLTAAVLSMSAQVFRLAGPVDALSCPALRLAADRLQGSDSPADCEALFGIPAVGLGRRMPCGEREIEGAPGRPRDSIVAIFFDRGATRIL